MTANAGSAGHCGPLGARPEHWSAGEAQQSPPGYRLHDEFRYLVARTA